ncbi:hypothetical protein MTR_2g103820 [Medicago truncatula]|uniref:Uncharacterized protein n=1 Tax=Medicago truncatula TaxID=3880 RepID=G7II66_MEDTR|nr:hypothetical protein MTR_2g103820 [Medicago truncatula]
MPCKNIRGSGKTEVLRETLNETNYEDRKDSLDLYLVINNLDLDLRTKKPTSLTNESTESHKIVNGKREDSNMVS